MRVLLRPLGPTGREVRLATTIAWSPCWAAVSINSACLPMPNRPTSRHRESLAGGQTPNFPSLKFFCNQAPIIGTAGPVILAKSLAFSIAGKFRNPVSCTLTAQRIPTEGRFAPGNHRIRRCSSASSSPIRLTWTFRTYSRPTSSDAPSTTITSCTTGGDGRVVGFGLTTREGLARLDLIGLGRMGLGRIGLGRLGLGRMGLDWIGGVFTATGGADGGVGRVFGSGPIRVGGSVLTGGFVRLAATSSAGGVVRLAAAARGRSSSSSQRIARGMPWANISP